MTTDPIHDAAADIQPAPASPPAEEASGEEDVIDGRNATQRKMDEELAKARDEDSTRA